MLEGRDAKLGPPRHACGGVWDVHNNHNIPDFPGKVLAPSGVMADRPGEAPESRDHGVHTLR
jgi:hypothetical protein